MANKGNPFGKKNPDPKRDASQKAKGLPDTDPAATKALEKKRGIEQFASNKSAKVGTGQALKKGGLGGRAPKKAAD